ncbi:MAG: hypothetical protein ACI9D5_000505 [Candidatus Endobugula sp.]|jgi:hypothetical protein
MVRPMQTWLSVFRSLSTPAYLVTAEFTQAQGVSELMNTIDREYKEDNIVNSAEYVLGLMSLTEITVFEAKLSTHSDL